MKQDNPYLWHRRRNVTAICDGSIMLIHRVWCRDIIQNFHHVCPICLSTLSQEEITRIKLYFIIRKLKS